MELSMGRTFQDFLYDIGDSLCKFANVFIAKVRSDRLAEYFPYPLGTPADKQPPVVGYQILPSETMEIMRDYHNKVLRYRQNIWGAAGAGAGFAKQDKWSANLLPQWFPHQVVHMKFDCRPGRAYGTPFIVAAMDDIVALRQVEEDIQNLTHRELFPFYKYTVGTEENPAEPEELEQAVVELEHMRTGNGLVLPERHDVDVVGAEGSVMEISNYLRHFKERVATGLGLSPHHLGMLDDSNKALADRLDVALYDKIKTYQRYISGVVQQKIFNELLLEGGFDPYMTPKNNKISDRCLFVFNEIDIDTQVKRENHTIQKWTSDIMMQGETRLALGLKPVVNEDQLYTAQSNRMMPAPGKPVLGGSAPGSNSPKGPQSNNQKPALGNMPTPGGGANNNPTKPDAQKPSTGIIPNQPQGNKKALNQLNRPINQYGRKMSSIKTSDETSNWLEETLSMIEDIFKEEEENDSDSSIT